MIDTTQKKNEQAHVDSFAHVYRSVQIAFDKKLVHLGYQTLKRYFEGNEGLELGSGDGDMTQYLVNDFKRLTVVDGSEQLLAGIPDAPNLVKVHSLFETFEPEMRYDTIVMSHIFEHIEDPVSLLRRAKHWLSPRGVLLAIVPNADSFHRLAAVKMGMLKHKAELHAGDLAVGHRRVYTPSEFRNDMEIAGLSVVKLGGIFFKPLANKQIQDQWSEEMIQGFYKLGEDFPENAAEIFVVCR